MRQVFEFSTNSKLKQARKGFRPPCAIFVIIFLKDFWNIFGIILEFFWNFSGGFFWRTFLAEFFWWNFLGDIFWDFFFEEVFFGRIFWEDFFGRIFFGRTFERSSTKSYLNMEGIDLFVKILVFVLIFRIAIASTSHLKSVF